MLSQASETYYQSYGVLLAVLAAGALLVAVRRLQREAMVPVPA